MRRVKTKKRRKFKLRIIIYALLAFCGYQISYNIILNTKLVNSNEDFIKCLLADSNYHMLYEKKANNLFNKLFSNFFNINEPVSILENIFHYKANTMETLPAGYVYNNENAVNNLDGDPTIFIYNSHQGEKYQGKALESYNITPSVLMASYIMQDKLAGQNVKALVMEDNLIDYMNLNNMKHAHSYSASRKFISPIIKQNPNLKLIIDLHRDSIDKSKSTTIINNKSCAKIVFVIGNAHDSYEQNLEFTNKLNDIISEKYPTLTRGVLLKGGAGSNGVYNQDLSSKMTLLEIGSDKNTIDEVLNTIELLAPIMGDFIHES